MPVKRRAAKLRLSAALSPAAWAFLCDQPFPEGTQGIEKFWLGFSLQSGHVHCKDGYSVESAWRQFGDEILADWIDQHPGTRPRCWWVYNAPRLAGTEQLPDPRRRIGRPTASGQTAYQEPQWDDADHLGHLGVMPLGGVYESQAAYLLRHGLLLPAEQPQVLLQQPERVPAPGLELDANGRIIWE